MKIEANLSRRVHCQITRRKERHPPALRHVLLIISSRFVEELSYGMLVCGASRALFARLSLRPKAAIAFLFFWESQKNFVAFYHMGLYASPEDMEWFMSNWGCLSLSGSWIWVKLHPI